MELPVSFLENMQKNCCHQRRFNAYLDSYSEERVYGLRVNTNKLTPEEFGKICPFEIKKIPWIDNGYYYSGKISRQRILIIMPVCIICRSHQQ